MKISHSILGLIAGLSLQLPAQGAENPVLAKVGITEISAEEINPYLSSLSAVDREALNENPALLTQLVRSIILQELIYKEAAQSGWDKKADVQAQIARAQKNAVIESYLQAVTKVPDGYPGEAEVSAVYEARKASLLVPQQYRVAQIFVALPKEADQTATSAAQARIESIRKALKQSEFGEVARTQSDEPESAARGGEVGWLAEASLQPEIKTGIGKLSKNAVSEPIRLNDGWYFIKLIDENPPHTATLDEVRPQLERALRQERLRQNREAFVAKLQQQNPISLNELGLSTLLTNAPKP